MAARSLTWIAIGGALVAPLFCLSASAQPRDVSSAPPGASSCLGCHGATPSQMPSLTQLSATDIEAAMEQYRSGAREATLMNRIAKGFSPEETKAIAAWLAQK